eukprot:11290693-Alexandrium_andersonii.AAC.1
MDAGADDIGCELGLPDRALPTLQGPPSVGAQKRALDDPHLVGRHLARLHLAVWVRQHAVGDDVDQAGALEDLE